LLCYEQADDGQNNMERFLLNQKDAEIKENVGKMELVCEGETGWIEHEVNNNEAKMMFAYAIICRFYKQAYNT
jgi:hypothetical protein